MEDEEHYFWTLTLVLIVWPESLSIVDRPVSDIKWDSGLAKCETASHKEDIKVSS